VIAMTDEKSLLDQVHEKERELAIRFERACAEADAAREAVVRERQGRLDQAEREAREAVEAQWQSAMAMIGVEIERMQRDAAEREREFRRRVEARIPDAAAELTRLVAPGA